MNNSKYSETKKVIEYSMRVLETIGKREGLTKKSLCNIIDFTKLVELNQSVRDNTSFEKYRSLGYDHEKLFMSYKDYLNEGQKEKEVSLWLKR